MAMCLVNPQPSVLPPSDVERMKEELKNIGRNLKKVDDGSATENTFEDLKVSLENLNEIVLSVDNSNDFFKIGGFSVLHPLLACPNDDVVALTAELIADLCQNNSFCQSKILDLNVLRDLVVLLEKDPVSSVCAKALYAVSCICRHNEESLKFLNATPIVPALMVILQTSNEKTKTKAAFFLSYLATLETFTEALYKAGIIEILGGLLRDQDSSTEHLLCVLSSLTALHADSRAQCRDGDLSDLIRDKITFYRSKSEFQECAGHCEKILENCFQNDDGDVER